MPLSRVLDSQQVYVTRGATRNGILEQPSKQMLEEAFETEDLDCVLETILADGDIQDAGRI